MSHVSRVAFECRLDHLPAACELLGCEFVPGQTRYRWYGKSVGDAPLPEGYTAAQLGHCHHVIRVKSRPNAYEVGVVVKEDGSCDLLFDEFANGYGLIDAIGISAAKLKQTYRKVEALTGLKKQGFHLASETVLADGSIQLKLRC